jgi:hypothetical protein
VLRRCARRGENILANVAATLSATNAPVTSRSGVPQALLALVSRGFLIPTNESDRSGKKSIEEKKKEDRNGAAPATLEKPETPAVQINADGFCNHGNKPLYCPTCKKAAKVPASRKLGFDPLHFREAVELPDVTLTGDDVHRIIYYHWKVSPDTWYRENVVGRERLLKKMPELFERFPADFKIPLRTIRHIKKNCPDCGETGYKDTTVDVNNNPWVSEAQGRKYAVSGMPLCQGGRGGGMSIQVWENDDEFQGTHEEFAEWLRSQGFTVNIISGFGKDPSSALQTRAGAEQLKRVLQSFDMPRADSVPDEDLEDLEL